MFWEKWIPAGYLVKSQVCGIEVLVGNEGLHFYGTLVKNRGGQLSVTGSFQSAQQPTLPDAIRKNKIPIVVCITGKGLMNKKIVLPQAENFTLEECIAQNIPTLNREEFYVQLHRQENGTGFLSVVRKDRVDAILQLFSHLKTEPADVILGPAFIAGVGPIASTFNRLETLCYALELSNNSVDTILETDCLAEDNRPLSLDGISLPAAQLTGFCAAFMYLTRAFGNYSSSGALPHYLHRHLEANKLRVLAYTCISAAFLLCLLNFFMFNSYFGQSRRLDTELSLYQGKYEQINELLDSYEKQKGLIEQAGILEASVISELSDKIAATVPDEVVLTEWVFNPSREQESEDSLVSFRNNTIFIRGNCNKSLIVNEWINVLKSQDFIAGINLEKFSFTNEGNQPNFELKITTE